MSDLLSADEITKRLTDLDGWSGDSSGLTRSVELPSFPEAIAAVDRIAVVAESMDHHPDIDIRWRTLTFACATHSAGGVTPKDFELAGRINEILAGAQ